MAVFNPEPQQVQDPTPLWYAGRFRDNQKAGALLSSVGQAIGDASKTATFVADSNIKDQVDNQTEKIRSLYGSDLTQSQIDNPAPPGVAQGLSKLDTLQQGYQTGQVSESGYIARLNAMTKQIKAQYPGYEDHVDQWVRQETGITPANALVDSLRRDAEKGITSRNALAMDRLHYEQSEGAFIERAFPGYMNNPGLRQMPFDQVVQGVNQIKAVDSENASAKSVYEVKAAQGKATKDDTEQYVRTTTGKMVNQFMSAGLGQDFEKKILSIQQSGRIPSPEEQGQIDAQLQQLKSKMQFDITHFFSQPGDNGTPAPLFQIDKSTRDDILTSATAPLDALAENIHNKDYGWAAIVANTIKAKEDNSVNSMLDNDPIKAYGAAQKIGGPALAQFVLNAADMDATMKGLLANKVANAVTAGGNTPNRSVKDDFQDLSVAAQNQGSHIDPKIYKSLVDTNVNILNDSSMPTQVKSNIVKYLFGNNDHDFLNMFKGDDQTKVFSNLVNEQTTKSIYEAAKSDPTIWHNYTDWAYKSFTALSQQAASEVKEINPVDRALMDVRYDATRGQFEVSPNKEAFQANSDPILASDTQYRIEKVYQKLNVALASINPVLKQDGQDVGKTVRDVLLPQLGVTASGDDGRGSQRQNDLENLKDKDQSMDTSKMRDFIGSSEGAGYNTMFGEAKDNSKYSLTNMTVNEVMDLQKEQGGSAAAGKYQIQRSTLSFLKRDMGLKGDEFMTVDMQDQMADRLMERRGLSAFAAGKMSHEQFADNLAREWASLPQANGKSVYEGMDGNHATTDRGSLLNQIASMGPSNDYVPNKG